MEAFKLNYRYRFPRFIFKNGETKYGMLYSLYNHNKKKLEHYFADANEIRKTNAVGKETVMSYFKKIKNRINISDVLEVEYLV